MNIVVGVFIFEAAVGERTGLDVEVYHGARHDDGWWRSRRTKLMKRNCKQMLWWQQMLWVNDVLYDKLLMSEEMDEEERK